MSPEPSSTNYSAVSKKKALLSLGSVKRLLRAGVAVDVTTKRLATLRLACKRRLSAYINSVKG